MVKSSWAVCIVLSTVAFALAAGDNAAGQVGNQRDSVEGAGTIATWGWGSGLVSLLDSAYASTSTSMRHEFFEGWLQESSDLERTAQVPGGPVDDIYAIFRDFYRPDTATFAQAIDALLQDPDLKSEPWMTEEVITAIVKASGLPREAGYIVVQAQVGYRVQAKKDKSEICRRADLSPSGGIKWTIQDSLEIHPRVQYYDKPVLYLTPKYRWVLDSYLALRPTDTTRAAHIEAFRVAGNRARWLFPEIAINPPCWGNVWDYVTFPEVLRIDFNADMTKAHVLFQAGSCMGGDACYTKSDGKWILQSREITWME